MTEKDNIFLLRPKDQEGAQPMTSGEAEEQVLLDGLSFVSEWPTPLAESLLADPTPWSYKYRFFWRRPRDQ
jgi:hypothetical protein